MEYLALDYVARFERNGRRYSDFSINEIRVHRSVSSGDPIKGNGVRPRKREVGIICHPDERSEEGSRPAY